jgi:hypothetical protein
MCLARICLTSRFKEACSGRGWTDLVVAFVGAWMEGLVRVAEGTSKQERILFFDGPFEVDISMPQKGVVNLSFVRNEKSVLSKTVEIKHLLVHGQSVARELLSQCEKRRWSDADTETLDRIVKLMRH